MKPIFLCLIVVVFLFSCKKTKVDQPKVDDDIIKKYILDNKLTAVATGTGLYYVTDVAGTGVQPNIQSTVAVAYKGYLTDGSVFDQSSSAGATFSLTSVIKGWQEGIPLYKKGGSGILLIPSALGYGAKGTSGIPPNSVLIFDVSLLNVQ